MALNKSQIVTIVSIIYLVILTVIACYAHAQSQHYSLPVSPLLTALTIVLPPLSGLLIERQHASLRHPQSKSLLKANRNSRSNTTTPLTTITVLTLTLLSTTLATLLGTHLAPASSLTCGLHEQWQTLFRAKNDVAIRRIQDGLGCCGLKSVYDMAWPFPDKGRSVCAARYERSRACFEDWRREEQVVAGLGVVVAVGCWVWMACVVYAPTGDKPSFFRRVFSTAASRDDAGDNADAEDGHVARRAIGYRTLQDRYVDDPLTEVEDGGDEAVEHVDRAQNRARNEVAGQQNGEGSIHHTLIPSALNSSEHNDWASR